MLRRSERYWLPSPLICAGLLIAGAADCAELNYGLRTGVDVSDNIDLVPSDTRNSVAGVAGLELNGSKDAGRLQYDIATDVALYDYLNHSDLDPELRGRAFMRGSYGFTPERFGWNASLGYSQLREDPLRPTAPGNRESETSLATGPWLRLPLGGDAMEVDLSSQYARQAYSKRPSDNETWGGRALLARRPTPYSLLAVGFDYDQVSYISNSAGNAFDYRRREAFVRTELRGARTGLQFEAGYADITGQLVDNNGPVLRLNLTRRLTPSLTGYVSAVREYLTSEPIVQQVVVPGNGGDAQLNGPRLATRIDSRLRFEQPRTQVELAYLWRSETAQTAQHESHDYGQIRGSFNRVLSPRVHGSLFASFGQESFSAYSADSLEYVYGAQLGMSLGRSLGVELRLQHNERNGNAQFRGYSEMSGGLYLRYGSARQAEFAQ